MKLIIEIEMDNAAFKPMPRFEVKRVLTDYLFRCEVESTLVECGLRDGNGNTVGSVKVEGATKCDECSVPGDETCAFCEGTFCTEHSAPGDHQDCLEDA